MYQLFRRSCLTLTFGALLVLPVWHLGNIEAEGAGLAGGGPWAQLADALGLGSVPAPLVGVLWSIEIFGLELMDPLAGASLLSAGSVSAAILIALLPTVLLVALLGRFFCGWLCPYVPILAASSGLRALLAKLGLACPDVKLGRSTPFVFLAVVLLLTAVGGTLIAPLLYPPAIIGRQLFRVVYFGGLGAGALTLVLIFVFDTFVSRAGFCRYLCPGGALFRILGAASPVRVRRDACVCEGCGACDVACSLGQSPMIDRLDSGCERCGKCVSACPNEALRMALGWPAFLGARRGHER
jgi:ferredoxin-type protein NapH